MPKYKYRFQKSDGRVYSQYHSVGPAPELLEEGIVRPANWQAPVLRYNAMRGEWVAVSASRNNRPFLPPREYCPLCPVTEYLTDPSGTICKTDVPIMSRDYEWAVFDNMFPGLAAEGGTGHCEVILYSPDHNQSLASCSLSHIAGLIEVWQDRSATVGAMPHIHQVFIFENRGTEVGVTLHHPHGQLYAFNHLPPFLAREQDMAAQHHAKTGSCLLCDLAKSETAAEERIITRAGSVIAFVPEAARYPYEVHITTLTHRPLLEHLSATETADLALVLKRVLQAYNRILAIDFPYIMAHHQASHLSPDTPSYHWHLEFYPPYRAAGKLKYLAGVESGTGLFINDTVAEEKAAELRTLIAAGDI